MKTSGTRPAPVRRMTNLEIQDFKDLYVWQRSMDLVLDVYRITETYPRHELFNLTTQTRKSAISIPSNVAEGANRHAPAAYVNHVNIAMGSEGELLTQLEIGRRLGYVSGKELERPLRELAEIGRMLNGLATSLELAIERQKAKKNERR
jgi:four helix bundle protein